jgi:N-acetyl-gamma-glutamyl-phosphate/LysW-gamma-L-alpha-aminoadipyl-6-phosphate reductase
MSRGHPMVHAVVLGAAGYGGGELARLLSAHPAVSELTLVSRSQAGKPVHSTHPHLRGLITEPFVAACDWRALPKEAALVVFAAQPHGEFALAWPALEAELAAAGVLERVTVIDLSGDHRLTDAAAFAAAYGKPHPHPERLGSFVYGLPEWQRTAIRGAARIANPGCFATALQLALLPFASRRDLGWVAVSAVTGSSGSGALPSDTTHHPTRAQDFRAYKVLAHQHLAEGEQLIAAEGGRLDIAMVPQSAPMVRGIFLSAQFRMADAAAAADAVRAHYADEPFVRVVEGSPRVAAVNGSNFADVGVVGRDGFLVVMVALDNLMKGMAGQAVQNMNLALGLDERLGLRYAAAYP